MSCFGDEGYNLFSTNNEYGEKYQYDPDFKGPKSRRSATDAYWFIAFLVFTAAWLTFGVCVLLHDPNHSNRLNDAELAIRDSPEFSVVFNCLKKTLWCYLGAILIATAICLILIFVMRWIATPVVWFSIFLMVASIGIVSIVSFVKYFEFKSKTGPNAEDEANTGLILGIIFAILTIIIAVGVYCFRHKIVVAIALIKEGSKAVASSYSTVFFPIIPLFFKIGFFAMFASIFANIQFFGSPDDDGLQFALHSLNVFGFLWAYCFFDAFEKMVLAHTFSTWYWTFNKENLPFFTLTTAVIRTTRYHLGTVALGSMILTIGHIICTIIRIIMNNRYMRVINLCCNIADLIERLIKFLNKNTYIMVAIHGEPFCRSMRDALNLLMRNIGNVYVTSRVTTLQFAIFNISISAAMGGLTYWLLPNDIEQNLMIYPILVAVIGSSIVAATFFGVYSMAIDTLFLCFLEDCERNDGTEQRPYYMSDALMRVLHKNSASLRPPLYEQA